MSGSHPRPRDIGHQVEAAASSDVDRIELMIEPQAGDSLDEFPPESLDLYSSRPTEAHEDSSGLLAFLPASPPDAIAAEPAAPSPVWQRRRRRLRKISAAAARHRTRVVTATSQLTAHLRRGIRASAAGVTAMRAGLGSLAGRVAATLRRAGQMNGLRSLRHALSQQVAGFRLHLRADGTRPQDSGPRFQVPGLRQPLRTHAARPRNVEEPAVGTDLSAARRRRRARIRQALTEAAGRDSAARIATVSQLTPVVARVVAASSASFVLRLHRRLKPAGADVHSVVRSGQAVAVNVAHRAGHATGRCVASVQAIAAAAAPAATAWSARFGRQSRLAVGSVAVSASSLAVRAHTATTRALTAIGPTVRMLHPRSVLVAAAMLGLIVVAGPPNGLSDMSARFAANSPTSPAVNLASTLPTAIEPAPRVPVLIAFRAPLEDTRPVSAIATAAAAPTAPVTLPENAATRIDPRAIQAVLNRYRDALSTLDVSGVRAVWPNADVGALQKQFAGVRDQNVEFEACRISSVASGARASCAGVIESGFRAGNRRPRTERRRWQFELRKFGASWRITDVQMDRG